MLIIEHTVETSASPAAIWEIWQDVARWNTWDHGIEMQGLLAFFFAFVIGRNMKKNLPQEMASMVKKAEATR